MSIPYLTFVDLGDRSFGHSFCFCAHFCARCASRADIKDIWCNPGYRPSPKSSPQKEADILCSSHNWRTPFHVCFLYEKNIDSFQAYFQIEEKHSYLLTLILSARTEVLVLNISVKFVNRNFGISKQMILFNRKPKRYSWFRLLTFWCIWWMQDP